MTEISMSWNKKVSLREIAMFYEEKLRELQGKYDAMINNLNEQISRFREKIQELDCKIAEYERQMDHHRDVLDLFTSTDDERMTSLIKQLVNEIKPQIYDYFEKLAYRDYEKAVRDINQRFKEVINDVVDKKHHIIQVVNVDAETARYIFERENDDNRQK